MVKTLIKPTRRKYSLDIPNMYVGKNVEVILYSTDELINENLSIRKRPSDFFGVLSTEQGEAFQSYVIKSREEWERNI